jgi:RNA polymerase sigma factor (sigma-70 family)
VPERLEEVALRVGGERLFGEAAEDVDRAAHLIEMRMAGWARHDVLLEAGTVDRRQGLFEVVGDRILTNNAKSRGERESRTVPMSFLGDAELEPGAASVEADRFVPDGQRWAGYWASSPARFDEQPESRLLSSETVSLVRGLVEELPEAQKAVIAMRDVAGCSADEVCDVLGISEGNQRVLLHRARTKVRVALEQHLGDEAP